MLNAIITPILATRETLTPDRVFFQVINPENNAVLVSGLCNWDRLPDFPQECLLDALTTPYHTIKQQFQTLPQQITP